jgi:hypothetical protein
MRLRHRHNLRLLHRAVGGWKTHRLEAARITRSFVRIINFPFWRWWLDYISLAKCIQAEKRLAIKCQALGRGGCVGVWVCTT